MTENGTKGNIRWAFINVEGDHNSVNFSPVIVLEMIGAILLAILAVGLIVGWQRSEKRGQRMVEVLLEQRGD